MTFCSVCKFPQDDYVGMYEPSKGESCPVCERLLPKAKRWFSNDEADVDLMISIGAISREHLIKMYIKENPITAGKGESTLDYEKMWNELHTRLEDMLGQVGYSSKASKRTQGVQQALAIMEAIEQEEKNDGIES